MTENPKDPTAGLNGAVAAELRAERAAKEISFEAIDERVSMSYRTLLRLFSAERFITIEALVEIAAALGVSVLEIVERAERRVVKDAPPPRRRGRRHALAMA